MAPSVAVRAIAIGSAVLALALTLTCVLTRHSPPRDLLAESARRIDATHAAIRRATFDELTEGHVRAPARIVPTVTDGRPDGFKLYAIRPGSLGDVLGFANGDIIQTLNGYDVTLPDKSFELETSIRDRDQIVVGFTRGGAPMTLTISVE